MISRLAAVRAAASGYAAGLILVRTRYSSANLFQRNERKGWFSGHTAQCISVCVCVCVCVWLSYRAYVALPTNKACFQHVVLQVVRVHACGVVGCLHQMSGMDW